MFIVDAIELEQARKRQFAEHMLRAAPVTAEAVQDAAFKSAMLVFGGDSGAAYAASQAWPYDADVLAIKDELIAAHGEAYYLPIPTREALAREVYLTYKEARTTQDKLASLKFYGDLQGWIEKPAVKNFTQFNNTQNNGAVFVVPEIPQTPEAIDTYVEETRAQQAKLISVS